MFPSPLEVDRFISVENEDVETQEEESFRPLSRYIGLYRKVIANNTSDLDDGFRPLSRYIGLYHA